ncbi:ead/Ea22-like family protein [Citrobacter koseri]|uniref:ead/Ea22-like family protein n=1 Tax=Citrobacter koseri TaxID=545 RepID=UPI00387E1457
MKPTYEELEAKVKQLEADNEKAMSVLKEANDAVLLAKSKFDALAAENAAAKHAVQAFCDVVGANTDAICEEVGQEGVKVILAAMSATGNMPATDAFLAEVRAQGVEKAIAHLENKFSNIGVQIMNLQWLADSLRGGNGE